MSAYEHDAKIDAKKTKSSNNDKPVDEGVKPIQDNSLNDSFNNDIDFLNNYSTSKKKKDLQFDRKKLCHFVMQHEVSKNGYE